MYWEAIRREQLTIAKCKIIFQKMSRMEITPQEGRKQLLKLLQDYKEEDE